MIFGAHINTLIIIKANTLFFNDHTCLHALDSQNHKVDDLEVCPMWLTFAGLVFESQDGAWDACERCESAHSFGGGAWYISKLFWSRFQQLPHWPGYTHFLQGKFGPSTISDALPVLAWPPFLRFFVSKECGPVWSLFLNGHLYLSGIWRGFYFKNGHQEDLDYMLNI